MRCVFGQRSTVLAFPNKMASKPRPCGAESTAKMIFQNDFFLCKINENLNIFLKFSLLFHFHNCLNILQSKISFKSI